MRRGYSWGGGGRSAGGGLRRRLGYSILVPGVSGGVFYLGWCVSEWTSRYGPPGCGSAGAPGPGRPASRRRRRMACREVPATAITAGRPGVPGLGWRFGQDAIAAEARAAGGRAADQLAPGQAAPSWSSGAFRAAHRRTPLRRVRGSLVVVRLFLNTFAASQPCSPYLPCCLFVFFFFWCFFFVWFSCYCFVFSGGVARSGGFSFFFSRFCLCCGVVFFVMSGFGCLFHVFFFFFCLFCVFFFFFFFFFFFAISYFFLFSLFTVVLCAT